jgi:hypothetical protein
MVSTYPIRCLLLAQSETPNPMKLHEPNASIA